MADTVRMNPVSAADWVLTLWGVLGAAANLGVVFLEASRRVKGWPWARPQGPGGGVYAVSVVVQLGIAGATTAAVSTTGIAESGFIAFGMGAAAPVVIKKLARYVQSLVPAFQEEQDDVAIAGDSDTPTDAGGGSDER